MLHAFVATHHEEIIRRCRVKVATRSGASRPGTEIDQGVPVFLGQLEDALRGHVAPSVDIARDAVQHGETLLRQGFTISDVVHRYGDVCQSITELAQEGNTSIGADDFRMLNLCLDDAIAGAVTGFGRQQNESTRTAELKRGNERAGFLAHEMRNLLHTATIAFELLKTGSVGVGGSTGTILHRSLMGARALSLRSLAEVRLTQGAVHSAPFLVAEFFEELMPGAHLDARARGIELRLIAGDGALMIDADRQILGAVVMNLLQNAFKFTKPDTTVVLRARASADRVLLEIQDECGGLPVGDMDDLFGPFEQRGADRTGAGLGLAFSRQAVEAHNGRLYARNLQDQGCVFTIDLPRVPIAAPAIAS